MIGAGLRSTYRLCKQRRFARLVNVKCHVKCVCQWVWWNCAFGALIHQGYVVVRVADQIGGGLETGCMVWTGTKCSKSLTLLRHVTNSFSPSISLVQCLQCLHASSMFCNRTFATLPLLIILIKSISAYQHLRGGCMLLGLAVAGALDHLLGGHILELGCLATRRPSYHRTLKGREWYSNVSNWSLISHLK